MTDIHSDKRFSHALSTLNEHVRLLDIQKIMERKKHRGKIVSSVFLSRRNNLCEIQASRFYDDDVCIICGPNAWKMIR